MEDKSGNIWFGTNGGGVCRFDGRLFINFSSQYLDDFIWCIIQDKTGNIWFGTDDGVSCYDGQTFKNFTTEHGLAANAVYCIIEDKTGNIWFGTFGGVSHYDGKSFINFTTVHGLVNNVVRSILEDKSGKIWFGTNGGGISCYDGQIFKNFTTTQGLANNTVVCIIEDEEENIWFGTEDGGVSRYDGKSFTNFTILQGLANNLVYSIQKDKKKNLWFSTFGGGVSRYDGKSFTNFTTSQGLSNNYVWSIVEDNIGNLWFGTYGSGISRFDEKSFTNYTTAQGLTNNLVFSILVDKTGNLWLGTYGGGVSCFNGKSFTNYTITQGLANNIVWSIIEDNTGNIWFGTMEGGVSCFDGKSFTNYTTAQGLANNMVTCILEDETGNIWFGTNGGGVSRYDGKSFTNYTTEQGLSSNEILCILKDKKENLWLCTNGGGISRYDGKSFLNFTTGPNFQDGVVTAMVQDKNDKIWFGTNFGIGGMCFEIPPLEVYPDKNKNTPAFLKNKKIGETFPADNPLSNEELSFYKPVFDIYNTETGYPIKDVNAGHNTMYCDSKGIIWIATGDDKTALVRFDPSALKKNPNPPTVVIQSIKIDEEKINWYNLIENQSVSEIASKNTDNSHTDGNTDSIICSQQEMITFGKKLTEVERLTFQKKFAGIQFDSVARFYPIPENLILPYDHNHITFDYAAIEPAKPYLVNYQCFMDGYDKGWMPITKNTNATYGNIHEGDYTFMVKALSHEGIWSDPIIYKFTVLPPWYRHPYAILGYILLFMVAFIVSIRLYTIRLRAQKKRLEQIVKDRTKEIQEKNIQLESTNIVIAQKNKDITDSINYARRIQLAIMEEKEVIYKQIPNSFILYMPRDIVSGDFYYYNKLNDDEVILAVCDCTGHGVPGAFMSMIGNDQLNSAIIEKKITTPSKILDQLHEGIRFALHQNKETSMVRDGMDLSLCKINLKKKEVEYAGAHRPLWILRNGKELSKNTHPENADTSVLLDEIKADKFPIGGYQSEENRIFTNKIIQLNSGDTVYMFTDGYLDQFGGPKKKKLTTKRFREKIIEIQQLPIHEQEKTLSEYFYEWKGEDEQIDDVMVIGIRF